MCDELQLMFRSGVTEYFFAHGLPIQRTISRDHVWAKRPLYGWQGSAARQRDSAGNLIGIQYRCARICQHGRDSAFAAANASGQPDQRSVGGVHRPTNASIRAGDSVMAVRPPRARNGPKGT